VGSSTSHKPIGLHGLLYVFTFFELTLVHGSANGAASKSRTHQGNIHDVQVLEGGLGGARDSGEVMRGSAFRRGEEISGFAYGRESWEDAVKCKILPPNVSVLPQ
jgi:hypothetical protein